MKENIFSRMLRGIDVIKQINKRKLSTVVVMLTDACNSRCVHCHLWQTKNSTFFNPEWLSNIDVEASVTLTGGEIFLHPRIDEIFQHFKGRSNWGILTNGIIVNKLIECVRKYDIPAVEISLDGMEETYRKVRGVDNFKNVQKIVEELGNKVSIFYTIIPSVNDSIEELKKVKRFADTYNIHLGVGIYNDLKLYNTTMKGNKKINIDMTGIRGYPINKYVRMYNDWVDGKVKIPCMSIRRTCIITPTSNVNLCTGINTPIGNVATHQLSEIWNNESTKTAQDNLKDCNKCWMNCNRPFDIIMNDFKFFKWLCK